MWQLLPYRNTRNFTTRKPSSGEAALTFNSWCSFVPIHYVTKLECLGWWTDQYESYPVPKTWGCSKVSHKVRSQTVAGTVNSEYGEGKSASRSGWFVSSNIWVGHAFNYALSLTSLWTPCSSSSDSDSNKAMAVHEASTMISVLGNYSSRIPGNGGSWVKCFSICSTNRAARRNHHMGGQVSLFIIWKVVYLTYKQLGNVNKFLASKYELLRNAIKMYHLVIHFHHSY